MKVKKYIAPSMAEAMKNIRAELGSDAVILNSREVHSGGFLGLFKKRSIEVIAATDKGVNPQQKPITKSSSTAVNASKGDFLQPEKSANVKMEIQRPSEDIIKEITDLKSKLNSLSLNSSNQGPLYPEHLQLMQKLLKDQEIDESLQNTLLTCLLEKWYVNGGNASINEVYSWLQKEMISQLSGANFGGISFKKKYINVVGPTGVGKTTTLAKIAADCVINHKKKVAFITTDTYRIAAIDQLKTYAKILNVPMEVCYTIDDFKKATESFEEYDVVLVDTAGRNFRNKQYVEDLKKVIDFDNEMETFLVLSLTSKQRDMEDIYEQFSIIEIDKFIFTKADETSAYGAMYNLITKYNKGVAYMTNGQNVPDDMIEVKPSNIAKTIIGVE
ncbi:flagellar biosynthesis protein FlhF [Bacillus sp. S/N-304-OC-R1]|uniref:flagellar biosynthesis protein FlhF n=1 Tax=Bacillus sp. S/N-304-OC-R1 TaxID=2758034 RepID=UPI001C8ED951|nr:flagellar biosynthesis protein FlhF [Bacillus sp. S/N-304-OC-R1]MBY0120677.1 flagellar biosynthesis protein FlhF [Bacillus sp. S/N-304-OC-R1]